jgi:hypothetical protein
MHTSFPPRPTINIEQWSMMMKTNGKNVQQHVFGGFIGALIDLKNSYTKSHKGLDMGGTEPNPKTPREQINNKGH